MTSRSQASGLARGPKQRACEKRSVAIALLCADARDHISHYAGGLTLKPMGSKLRGPEDKTSGRRSEAYRGQLRTRGVGYSGFPRDLSLACRSKLRAERWPSLAVQLHSSAYLPRLFNHPAQKD